MQPDTNSSNPPKQENTEGTDQTPPNETGVPPETEGMPQVGNDAGTAPESTLDAPASAEGDDVPETASVEEPAVSSTPEAPVGEEPAVVSSSLPTDPMPVVTSDSQPMAGAQSVATMSSGTTPVYKRAWVKFLVIALIVVILLGGGVAFALFSVIIPNEPESVVVNSVLNSARKNQVTVTGKVNYTTGGMSTLTQFTAATNLSAKATDLQLNVTISGVTIPAEVRLVGQNAYLKFSDLKPVAALVSGLSPSYAPLVSGVAGQLSNKWIEVDSTLLDEMGLSCTLNTNLAVTDADASLLKNMYMKHRFVSATSEGNETISGIKTTKYNVSVDDNTFAAFAGSLNNLSLMKSLQKCDKNAKPLDTKSFADGDKTPLTIWVDRGSKEVVQVQSTSTAKDAKSGIKGDATLTFNYTKPVNITAPQGAVPAMQVLSGLAQADPTLGLLLGGLTSSSSADSSSSVQAKARDSERQTDLRSLQAQLEAYYAEQGSYPSLANVNSASWRATNMQGLDAQALEDPQGTSATLVATPQAKAYAYQVTGGSQHYTLTATLEAGSPFVLKSLD